MTPAALHTAQTRQALLRQCLQASRQRRGSQDSSIDLLRSAGTSDKSMKASAGIGLVPHVACCT